MIDLIRTGQDGAELMNFALQDQLGVTLSSIVWTAELARWSKNYCINTVPGPNPGKIVGLQSKSQKSPQGQVGLGDKLVAQLVDAGLVNTFADLCLDVQSLMEVLPVLPEKSATSLIEAIDQARPRAGDAIDVLFGLGIPQVGVVAARTLAEHFDDHHQLLAATAEI